MSTRSRRFEDLLVWQRSRVLANRIFKLCDAKTLSREYVLCDQLKRAAISIMANLAEGYDRGSRAEFHQFLLVAKGSCAELRSHLVLVSDLGRLSPDEPQSLIAETQEISRMIGELRAAVRSKLDSSPARAPKPGTRDSRLATRD